MTTLDASGVSVVLPTKDRLPWLRAVLPTYFEQPEVKEIVVVIDGSSDGTQEYLKELSANEPRLLVLDNGRNKGIPYSKNRGIAAASYATLFFGEDDLELTPNFIATLLAHKDRIGAQFICGRNVWRYEGESAEAALGRTAQSGGPYVDLKRISINTSLALAEDEFQMMLANPMLGATELFRAIRFDERYTVNFWREETDFQITAKELGYKLACCPHAICFNYMIAGDRGGSHAAAGLRRTAWCIVNNKRFVRKHSKYLRENFNIGNEYAYLCRFAVRQTFSEVILPLGIEAKRRVLGRATAQDHGEQQAG